VVWAGGGIVTERCPKSIISGVSVAWLEQFCLWQAIRHVAMEEWDARTVEAMFLLEDLVRRGG
jgi:hypothetical protein